MRLIVIFPCKLNSFQILCYCDSYWMLALCYLHSLNVLSIPAFFFFVVVAFQSGTYLSIIKEDLT
jgi:hypothetical protein